MTIDRLFMRVISRRTNFDEFADPTGIIDDEIDNALLEERIFEMSNYNDFEDYDFEDYDE